LGAGNASGSKRRAISEASPATLLLVEDDPIVRMDMAERLLRRGFRVFRLSSADQALRIMETHSVDGILSDMRLAGSMSGLELIRVVAKRWPGCGMVLVSGMGSPALGDLPLRSHFLSKPVSGAALDDTLRELGLMSEART
jgi:DNA-binding NtrC family response regulator